MCEIAFVILIYNLFDEVSKCISSIMKRIDTNNYMFVIVDNGSNNNIGLRLKEKYKNDKKVIVKILDTNIGFARGNNVGISIARDLNARFICCLNDDTRLLSDNLVAVLNEKYAEQTPAIIGPKIIELDVDECKYNHRLFDIPYYENKLRNLKEEKYIENKLDILKYLAIQSKALQPVRFAWHHIRKPQKCEYQTDTLGLVLNGCCLFFTPIFFEHLDGFNPDTFLYYEEQLLYASIAVNNLQSLYTPKIKIAHLKGVSTRKSLKKRENVWNFRQKYYIDSITILINYLKDHEREIYDIENK